jgi:N-formylmaleamate deformylase
MTRSPPPAYRARMRFALFLAIAAPLLAGSAAPIAATAAFAPTRFTVETVGSGPDVILIPGLTASREVWRSTVAAIPGYRYHLIQVSGFAGAPTRGNARGPVVAPLADEIAHYIEANHLGRPAIVGHSMGGTVALMLAERHPDDVGKVMVVDMLPEPAELLGASASGISGLADTLQEWSGNPVGKSLIESAIRLFGNDDVANLNSDPDVVARAAHELALTNLAPDLPRIRAPLTIVYASPDAVLAPAADAVYRDAYARDPAARLVRIDGSGHMVMEDQPRRFEAALKTFLAGK